MNILIYILVILMAISITTYTRLQTFITTSATRAEYVCYIQQEDHALNNALQYKQYDDHKGERNQREQSSRTNATRKINFGLFTQQKLRESNQNAYNTFRIISTRLIENLYGNEPFYLNFQEKRGNAAEIMMNTLIAQADALPDNKKITDTDDLKALDLQDQELQELFAKMLKGELEFTPQGKCTKTHAKPYPPFLKFIEIKNSNTMKPLRIQLLPKEVLLAIFNDEGLVNDIIVKREELRQKSGKVGSTEQQVASNEFENLFKKTIPNNFDPQLFNFDITKTKNKND